VCPGRGAGQYGIRPIDGHCKDSSPAGCPAVLSLAARTILDLPLFADFQINKASAREKITHQGTFKDANRFRCGPRRRPSTRRHDRRLRPAIPLRRHIAPPINEVFEEEHCPWAAPAWSTFISSHNP